MDRINKQKQISLKFKMMNKKFLTLFVAATFVVSSFAPFAKAATIDEQIAALLAQIAALQGQVATSTGTATGTTCFSNNLSYGMTHADVKLLQEKLGVSNTGYFGPLTLAAVKTYQANNAISPVAGYVGPLTRASLNAKYCTTSTSTSTVPGCASGATYSATTGALCTTATSTVPGCAAGALFSATTGASCTTGTTSASGTATEGTLVNTTSATFVETSLKKGDVNKAILATTVEARNSDITLKRADVELAATSIQPWKTFSSFGLYANGVLVKEISAAKENFIETTFVTKYVLRFDNISIVVAKGQKVDLVVKTTVLANPENTAITTFKFLASAIRGVDGAGIDQYTSTEITNTISGDAVAASSTGTLVWSLNTASPKTGFVTGSATVVSSDKTLAIYDIKAENRDVTIKTLLVTMTDADTIVSAVKLYDGATLLASVAGANGDVTFDNLAILIAKDTTKTLTVKVDLKPLAAEGKLIAAVVTGSAAKVSAFDSTDAILGAKSCGGGECITGTATGKTLTAYTKAPLLTFVSSSFTKTVQAGQADQGDAIIVFDVTAVGGDIFINKAATALGTITVDDGVAATDTFAGGLGTYTFTSTAEAASADVYVVRSGQTARFTISGHVINKATTGYMHMAMDKLIWGTAVGTPTTYNLLGISATVNYDLSNFITTDISLTHV